MENLKLIDKSRLVKTIISITLSLLLILNPIYIEKNKSEAFDFVITPAVAQIIFTSAVACGVTVGLSDYNNIVSSLWKTADTNMKAFWTNLSNTSSFLIDGVVSMSSNYFKSFSDIITSLFSVTGGSYVGDITDSPFTFYTPPNHPIQDVASNYKMRVVFPSFSSLNELVGLEIPVLNMNNVFIEIYDYYTPSKRVNFRYYILLPFYDEKIVLCQSYVVPVTGVTDINGVYLGNRGSGNYHFYTYAHNVNYVGYTPANDFVSDFSAYPDSDFYDVYFRKGNVDICLDTKVSSNFNINDWIANYFAGTNSVSYDYVVDEIYYPGVGTNSISVPEGKVVNVPVASSVSSSSTVVSGATVSDIPVDYPIEDLIGPGVVDPPTTDVTGILSGINSIIDWLASILAKLVALPGSIASSIVGAFADFFNVNNFTLDFSSLKNLGIKDKFPFSIPFDLYNTLKTILVPVAEPDFHMNINNKFIQIDYDLPINLSQFTFIRGFMRWSMIFGFIIGLIKGTKNLIKW